MPRVSDYGLTVVVNQCFILREPSVAAAPRPNGWIALQIAGSR